MSLRYLLDKYKIQNILIIFLIGYLLIIRIKLIFSYSVDLDGAEFVFVYYVQRLLANHTIYNNPTEFPYLACLFVPIYLYTLKTIVSVFSISKQSDMHFIYIVGRSFSLVLFLLQLVITTTYFRKRFSLSFDKILIIVLINLLLISGHMYVIRPDAMKFLLFSINFILLVEYEFFRQRFFYLMLFLLLAVFNVFIKQDTVVYACVMILSMLVVTRKIKYLGLFLLFITFVFIAFNIMKHVFGEYFYTNVILFNFQTIDHVFTSINMMLVVYSLGRLSPLLFILFIFLIQYKSIKKDALVLFVLLFLLSSLIVSHLFILRAGSNINYAYESIFSAFFLLAILISKVNNLLLIKKHTYLFVWMYVTILFFANLIIHNYRYDIEREKALKVKYYKRIEDSKILKSIVNNNTCFFPNIEYALFSQDCNMIYGYDYNIGRFISLVMPIKINTKLTYFDSKNYDDCFKNGTVKYIINETSKNAMIQLNYPNYQYQTKVGDLSLFIFK